MSTTEKPSDNTLADLDRETLLGIIDDMAKNWLAHDGLWFQAIEQVHDIGLAIEMDQEVWRRFSPIEAKRIKARFNIGDNPGIPGLVKALGYRMYARLNIQEVLQQTDTSVIFRMCDCRVQSARQRKNMPLFPCKSVGISEYSEFASTIDDRISTEVITCPPDAYNGAYFCAWKFTLHQDRS